MSASVNITCLQSIKQSLKFHHLMLYQIMTLACNCLKCQTHIRKAGSDTM